RVGGVVRRPRRGVVDGEPLPVGARVAVAAEDALADRRTAVVSARDPQAGERVEIREVLVAGSVEVEVGVAAARWVLDALDRRRRRWRRDHSEAVTAVDRALPGAALCTGAGRAADEHA